MTLARAVALRWGGGAHVAALLASAALLRVWDAPIDVPGRDDVRALVSPLVPVVVALVAADGSRVGRRDLERLSSIGDRNLRIGYCVAVLASLVVVALAGQESDRFVLLRNGLLLAGVGIGGATVLSPSIAWPPVVLLPMVCWLLGSRGVGVAPAPWAVLLLPDRSVAAGSAVLLVVVASVLAYLRGSRTGA